MSVTDPASLRPPTSAHRSVIHFVLARPPATRFAALSPLDVAICFGAGVFSILGFELVKLRKPGSGGRPG